MSLLDAHFSSSSSSFETLLYCRRIVKEVVGSREDSVKAQVVSVVRRRSSSF